MKHKVRVWLKAETSVVIEVDAEPGEDPAHLTDEEERRALADAPYYPKWEVDFVRKASE
jgi:hypothetical protein